MSIHDASIRATTRTFAAGEAFRSGRPSLGVLPSALVVSVLLLAACSGGKDRGSRTPPMLDTGAKPPDPCRLVGGEVVDRLVGPSTVVREKGGENLDCRWESRNDPSPKSKSPSGLLQVGAFTQSKQVKSAEKYNDAKIAYRAAQLKKPCAPVRLSADEACWQQDELGLHVAVRKGYTTITISYSAARSRALDERKREQTATALATEVLKNLSA
jgi:hypothetical protein